MYNIKLSNPEYLARVLTEDVKVVGKLVEIKRRYNINETCIFFTKHIQYI